MKVLALLTQILLAPGSGEEAPRPPLVDTADTAAGEDTGAPDTADTGIPDTGDTADTSSADTDSADTGSGDTDSGDTSDADTDSGDTSDADTATEETVSSVELAGEAGGCGCASPAREPGGSGVALVLAGLLGWVRRRRLTR